MKWFEVDKAGLAALLEKRGRAWAVCELIQNAWDQDVSNVEVTVERIDARTYTLSVVDDDPNGWQDITHAFTLFAPSAKKADPTKRGRFNLGEKLVLALCSEAEIVSVNSAVRFDAKGRHTLRRRRESGSEFRGTLRMTLADLHEVEQTLRSLLPPRHIRTSVRIRTLSGTRGRAFRSRSNARDGADFTLERRNAKRFTAATLPTVIEGDGGALRRTRRKARVELVEPREGETPHLYEMGIPVVELDGGDRWHINVLQKVPLNLDRDNVTPAYLREVRVIAMNCTHDLLSGEEMKEGWVSDATGDERCLPTAVESMVRGRYGDKCVAHAPGDPESNARAVAAGYTVVPGGSMTKGQWANVKENEVVLPASQVTPSPKPYSTDPNAKPVDCIPYADWSDDQKLMVDFAKALHSALIPEHAQSLRVRIVNTSNGFSACYAPGALDLNLRRLGHLWFRPLALSGWIELLIHEFAHYYESNHLSSLYYDALCRMGARLAKELCKDGSKVRTMMRSIQRGASAPSI